MRVVGEATVYRNPHPNHRPIVASSSTLCHVGGGRLLCAFRTGAAKMSPDGRIALAASDDGGATWTPVASPFGDDVATGWSLAGAHLGADEHGAVVLGAARMAIVAPGEPGWDDDAGGIVDADAIVARLGGGGAGGDRAWEAPVVVDGRRHDDEWAIPCGPPLALGGGRWIWPLERHGKARTPGWLRRYHAFAMFSDDDGRTWPRHRPMLNGSDGRLAHYDQRIVRLEDGRLRSMAWVHDVDADITLTARTGVSDDGGETWSEPVDTGIVGGPINPIRLADGRILAVYNRRTHPAGVRCVVSTDGGASWEHGDEFVLYDEAERRIVGEPASRRRGADGEGDPSLWGTMWGWTFGTPTAAQVADGTVVVTFFAMGGDGVTAIRAARLEV